MVTGMLDVIRCGCEPTISHYMDVDSQFLISILNVWYSYY